MNTISIIGAVLVIAVLSVTLKRYAPEYAIMVNIIAGAIILSIIMAEFIPAASQIKELISSAKLSKDYAAILFKSLGICFLTQFASDACRDAEENSLATKVELTGKISILIISLPLFEKITKTAISLIGG